MLIFKIFAGHNLIKIYTKTHRTAPYFHFFLGDLAYVRPMHATIVHVDNEFLDMDFYMKIAIFNSRLFKNTQQNEPIVNVLITRITT